MARGTGQPCRIDGCELPDRTRRLCENHYAKWRRWGDSLTPPPKKKRLCTVDGCSEKYSAKGYCKHHYMRVRDYGDPEPDFGYDRDQCGTEASYFKRGCRCDECRDAGRRARKRWRKNAAQVPMEDLEHGNVTTYVNYRCRCDSCRAAWADYRRDGNRQRRLKSVAGQTYTSEGILARDGWRCQLCREKIPKSARRPDPRSASIDHIVPLSVGGIDCATNVQAAHLECNIRKGNRAAGDQLRLTG